jgi:hypothetical protein
MFPTFHFSVERWKYNKTFEVYVSNKGHFRNSSKADLAPMVLNSGYLVVRVGGSSSEWMLAHRLVMLTWRPTPEAENLTVDHKNHNKRDNSLDNLEWVTEEENYRRAREDLLSGYNYVGGRIIPCKTKKKWGKLLGVRITHKHNGFNQVVTNYGEFVAKYTEYKERNHVTKMRQIIDDIVSGKNSAGYRIIGSFTVNAVHENGEKGATNG